ncbi:unnamed protein product [marine sediment metagenome]|uniref:RNA polymerase sigma-70 region 1.2 domain-containing protein n=1 Tax=marine sediment metagenome TaxID=412755 RepID=X1VA08_9ZZZZ
MTLDEAILRQENMIDQNEGEIGREDIQAMKLGTEAMKRIKDYRQRSSVRMTPLLPGETEE